MYLKNDRLCVEIAEPGTVYKGSRFDWTGFITQVTLDGRHTFCIPESLEPGIGTGGIGICNEFGITDPIGYDDAKPGDKFLKPGIGLLTKPDDEPYSFGRPYEISTFAIKFHTDGDSVIFSVEPVECRGYAVRLEKILSIKDSSLEIKYRLENTGSKTFLTHEYCHNFISINSMSIGPEYCLTFPYAVQVENVTDNLIFEGNHIGWKRIAEDGFYLRTEQIPEGRSHWWELVHIPSGAGMRETNDFQASVLALWGVAHVVSPEVFIEIHLKPGEVKEWTRKYEFFEK